MSLLFAREPIVVNKDLACAIGLNEAVVLQQVNYWLQKSNHEIDGKVWVYNSMNAWQDQFPFWSYDTVKRIFSSLVKDNLLISGNYNKSKMDKTKWYTINFSRLGEIEQSIGANCPNGEGQYDPMDWGNMTQPIPEITQETTAETTEKYKKETPLSMLIAFGVPEQLATDWLSVRKAKKSPLTKTALDGVIREADKASLTLEQAITLCVERNWVGFSASWLEKNIPSNSLPIADKNRAAADEARKILFGGAA